MTTKAFNANEINYYLWARSPNKLVSTAQQSVLHKSISSLCAMLCYPLPPKPLAATGHDKPLLWFVQFWNGWGYSFSWGKTFLLPNSSGTKTISYDTFWRHRSFNDTLCLWVGQAQATFECLLFVCFMCLYRLTCARVHVIKTKYKTKYKQTSC